MPSVRCECHVHWRHTCSREKLPIAGVLQQFSRIPERLDYFSCFCFVFYSSLLFQRAAARKISSQFYFILLPVVCYFNDFWNTERNRIFSIYVSLFLFFFFGNCTIKISLLWFVFVYISIPILIESREKQNFRNLKKKL